MSDTLVRRKEIISIMTYSKRTMVTLLPEWEPELDQLKKERFYNKTQADMFRYIISRGLDTVKQEKTAKENSCDRVS